MPTGPAAPISEDDLWPYTAAFAERLAEMLTFQWPDVVHAHRYSWDRAAADTAAVYERTVWRRAGRQTYAQRDLQDEVSGAVWLGAVRVSNSCNQAATQ